MATLVDATFSTDLDGFDAGTRSAIEGENFDTGVIAIGSSVQASKSFTAATSGKLRMDFSYFAPDAPQSGTSRDHRIFLLPTSGTVSTTNAAVALRIARPGTNTIQLERGDSTGTYNLYKAVKRYGWIRLSVVVDFSTYTYDLYINDILFTTGLACPNGAFTDISRVVLYGGSTAPTAYFDSIKIESDWALPSDSLLVSDDFTTSTGTAQGSVTPTDDRAENAQPWSVPLDTTTYGVPVRTATGLQAVSAKDTYSLARCAAEGQFEVDFVVSTAGVTHCGLLYRCYAGLSEDGWMRLRYLSNATAGQQLRLELGDSTVISQSDGTTGGVSYTAGSSHTLKVVARGRYHACYVDNQLQFTGLYNGDRGVLSEEFAGPWFGTSCNADVRIEEFRFTGRQQTPRTVAVVGGTTAVIEPGSIRELYLSGGAAPTRNLYASKGNQFGHRATADMGNYYTAASTNYSTTNCVSVRQRSMCMPESTLLGWADVYITVTRRGIWAGDRIMVWNTSSSWGAINIAPDNDFRPDLWAGSYLCVGPTGASDELDHLPYSDWHTDIANVALPIGFQVASTGAGARISGIFLNNEGLTGTVHNFSSKLEGDGDPISHAAARVAANLVDYGEYEWGRAYYIEPGQTTLSASILEALRDDLATPASIATFTTGSLKTDAAGDLNTDGFNERYGWYEITCSGGTADFTFPVSSGTRYMPQFRLNGWTNTYTAVTIAGSLGSSGTDYWLDDLGDGNALLQLNSNRTGNTTIALSTPGGATVKPWYYYAQL